MTPGLINRDAAASSWRGDALAAVLLSSLLAICWAIKDWPQLAHLNLPDTDDMMRLAQVRDWVAGQAANDWTQHRLGPPGGAPMHWSRIADLGPAAIIIAAQSVLSAATAERVAILTWPALLFAVALFLIARVARRIGPSSGASIALIVGATAYPANSLFLPGRIDHHGLQICLVLGAVLALARPPSRGSGIAAGGCAAASFGIGLETAPQIGALMGALFILWVARGARESSRVTGFGLTLAGCTAGLLAFARPTYWSPLWCDAFTPASSTATLAGGAVFVVLGLVVPALPRPAQRLTIGGGVAAAALAAAIALYPVCLTGPYGPMTPFLRGAMIDNIVEARGLFAGPVSQVVEFGVPAAGLMVIASIVAGVLWLKRPSRRMVMLPLIAALAISDLVLLSQLRAAYVGSALTAPILAQLILAAREHRSRLVLIGAWAISAGMLWLLVPMRIAAALAPQSGTALAATRSCRSGDVWEQVDAVRTGTVMASAANGAYVVGGTRHRSIGAGFHRNNAGNTAMYAFFLAAPGQARSIGRRWSVDYVVFCPTDFSELEVTRRWPTSLAATLAEGHPPPWLVSIPLRNTGLKLYRVEP